MRFITSFAVVALFWSTALALVTGPVDPELNPYRSAGPSSGREYDSQAIAAARQNRGLHTGSSGAISLGQSEGGAQTRRLWRRAGVHPQILSQAHGSASQAHQNAAAEHQVAQWKFHPDSNEHRHHEQQSDGHLQMAVLHANAANNIFPHPNAPVQVPRLHNDILASEHNANMSAQSAVSVANHHHG